VAVVVEIMCHVRVLLEVMEVLVVEGRDILVILAALALLDKEMLGAHLLVGMDIVEQVVAVVLVLLVDVGLILQGELAA
jgi:hypothetical protein